MKRFLPWILLLLSLGVNVGLFGALAVRALRGTRAEVPVVEPAVANDTEPAEAVESELAPVGQIDEEMEAPFEEIFERRESEVEAAVDKPAESPTEPFPRAPAEESPDTAPTAPAAPRAPIQRISRLADELGLVGERRRGFIALQRRFFREVQSRRLELGRLQRSLQQEVLSGDPSPRRLRQRLAQIGQAYARLDGAFVQNIMRSRDYLDAQQERRFLELLGRMRERARPTDRQRRR